MYIYWRCIHDCDNVKAMYVRVTYPALCYIYILSRGYKHRHLTLKIFNGNYSTGNHLEFLSKDIF